MITDFQSIDALVKARQAELRGEARGRQSGGTLGQRLLRWSGRK